jgi:phage host-nuclease inhibitor protein Gam
MKRIKLQSTALSRAEVETLVGQIAEATNSKRATMAEIDEHILALRKQYEPGLTQIETEIKTKSALVKSWAEANREEFGKLKSIRLTFGTIGFRTGTPKLTLLSRWTWDKALAAVQTVLPAFVRSKPEIDKEAIIAQRAELGEFLPMAGLKITQAESFFIEPDLAALEKRVSASA